MFLLHQTYGNDYLLSVIILHLGWGQVAGTCEYGNEPSGSVKFGEFLV